MYVRVDIENPFSGRCSFLASHFLRHRSRVVVVAMAVFAVAVDRSRPNAVSDIRAGVSRPRYLKPDRVSDAGDGSGGKLSDDSRPTHSDVGNGGGNDEIVIGGQAGAVQESNIGLGLPLAKQV